MIKLINGPYNGIELEDSGAVRLNMALGFKPGHLSGNAIYEPNEDRTLAFWLTNEWDGTIEETIIPF